VAVATPLGDVGADRPGLATLASAIRERCVQILDALGRPTGEMRESLDAVRSPAALGDQVASAVLPDVSVRQSLLEELDVERRLKRLQGALDDLLKQLSGGRPS
jgi:hypothetical protein